MILFARRLKLGRGSTRGMMTHLATKGITAKTWRSDKLLTNSMLTSLVVRWGATATLPHGLPECLVLNSAVAIHRVNNKKLYRQLLQTTNPQLVPKSIFDLPTTIDSQIGCTATDDPQFPLILRPKNHAQGRNLHLVQDVRELGQFSIRYPEGWYASEYVDKESEYRVYVANGRVVTIAQKTPADPTAIAWNVAQGGRFDVLPRGQWPMEVCRVGIESFRPSGLDFGGVDVMVEKTTGRTLCIEINSAPSLPSLSDGSVSYRQKCMAEYFEYVYQNNNDWIEPDYTNGWRGVIHPSVNPE
jgi:glutathione synthase/RimK-type ligase-like ATP-grasp enzyme